MEKIIACPICENGKLSIEIKDGQRVITSGKFGKYPYKVYCKSCHRFIKYNIEKDSN